MSIISIPQIHHVASLAKIALTDEEATAMQAQLGTILEYVRQLDALDTTAVEPTYQVTGLTNVVRGDVLIDYGASQSDLLKNAPATQSAQIKVPKVL